MALLEEQDLVDQAGGQDRFDALINADDPNRAAKISALLVNGDAFIRTKLGRRFGSFEDLGDPDLVAPVRMYGAQYAILQFRLMREAGVDENLNAAMDRVHREMENIASGINWPGDEYGPEQTQRAGIGFHPTLTRQTQSGALRRLLA